MQSGLQARKTRRDQAPWNRGVQRPVGPTRLLRRPQDHAGGTRPCDQHAVEADGRAGSARRDPYEAGHPFAKPVEVDRLVAGQAAPIATKRLLRPTPSSISYAPPAGAPRRSSRSTCCGSAPPFSSSAASAGQDAAALPAVEVAGDAGPGAVAAGQVVPRRAGVQHPEDAVEHPPMIVRWALGLPAPRRPSPMGVRQIPSVQAGNIRITGGFTNRPR
ncbi:MAG: hypothetical protein JWM10_4071 [Myxococcaceae bacterium]|nr:hypothetical protein [Myxococcaceae bacterium]